MKQVKKLESVKNEIFALKVNTITGGQQANASVEWVEENGRKVKKVLNDNM